MYKDIKISKCSESGRSVVLLLEQSSYGDVKKGEKGQEKCCGDCKLEN